MTDQPPPLDVLAVGAHPDDVELTSGGTLAALARRGKRIGILDLTRGEAGTRGTPGTRAVEAAEAARLLGAVVRETLDLGDGGLRTGREEELQVIEVLRRHRPRLIIAPEPADRHPDHARAGRLVTEAAFYAGIRSLATADPPHRPQHVVYAPGEYAAAPAFLIDISAVFEVKLAAIGAYRSQFHDPESTEPETFISSKGYVEGVTARARALGRLANVAYAEGFLSRRPPLLSDPLEAFEGYEPGFPR